MGFSREASESALRQNNWKIPEAISCLVDTSTRRSKRSRTSAVRSSTDMEDGEVSDTEESSENLEIFKDDASEHSNSASNAESEVDETEEEDVELVEDAPDSAAAEEAFELSGEPEVFDGGLRVPRAVFDHLMPHQRTGLQWMWELHCQGAGGLIGDDMGLGKTVQIAALLCSLQFSGLLKGPAIVLAPATVLRHWQRELRKWAPNVEPQILHASEQSIHHRRQVVESCFNAGGAKTSVLITTYEGMRVNRLIVVGRSWDYVILDEGHKIRNPDAEVTLACKRFQTTHRLVLSGAPVQNNLVELWSVFDFVFPGRLGTLPVFESEFATPIRKGGYSNATPEQVHTAYQCAVALRDMIGPYMLRRLKSEVKHDLPEKTEHILMCSLTERQRAAYMEYLTSRTVRMIQEMRGTCGNLCLAAIMHLRKICNHSDLVDESELFKIPDYGNPARSGKLLVLQKILTTWKTQGHRVLVFSQSKPLLDILEQHFRENGFEYRRMDGDVNISSRQKLIDEFNTNPEIFVFLLTTRVGGLGVNLTGANRVVIFDPDWNPSTDDQAKERAWRIGQTRGVAVYRLITRGTIEEKIYHRQIFKHCLINRVLKDARQQRFFKDSDLEDLFAPPPPLRRSAQSDGKANSNNAAMRSETEEILEDMSIDAGFEKPEEANGDGETATETGDNLLLKNLLENAGISSALSHDKILSPENNQQDVVLLRRTASRIAQEAIRAVRESAAECATMPVSLPTWTGRSGVPNAAQPRFGKPSSSSRASVGGEKSKPIGSAEILQGLKVRHGEGDPLLDAVGVELRNLFISYQNVLQTEEIAKFANQRIGRNEEQQLAFKQMLKQMAGRVQGSSVWVLREEFR
eukprot:c18676_g1_i1.p1 GENE.c18676_g1_i1~~c18676_g1_i1.p1  ORF type:complete len:860 (+),score=196.90 c18676_g1_i1:1063-3642(+)